MALAEVAGKGRPVVHLKINVQVRSTAEISKQIDNKLQHSEEASRDLHVSQKQSFGQLLDSVEDHQTGIFCTSDKIKPPFAQPQLVKEKNL